MKRNSFEKKIAEKVVQPYVNAQVQSGYGIVITHDKVSNTATVLMAQSDSDLPGDMYHDVPCPVQLGIQSVNPEKGRTCWVTFKNNDRQYPVITHFYNYYYADSDGNKQQNAKSPLPRFIFNL